MAYNILGKDDENLRVTVTEAETPVINIQPASFTITGSGAPVDSVNGYTGVVVLDTDDIAEGANNLYYTDARVDANIAGKTTSDLAEGANLYYTDARVDARLLAGVPDIHADQLQLTGMPGHMTWNSGEGTIDLPLNANVTLQVGQEETHLVRNLSGTTLVNGAVVRVTGASGNRLTVTHADNLTEGTSSATIGVMTESVGNNSAGYMTVSGLVRGLNTSAYPEGSALWLGTNGSFTTTKPPTPAHLVLVGWVVRSHAVEGSIFVHVQNGQELEELHDVLITNPLDGEALVYDAANGYWKNGDVSVDLSSYATIAYVDAQSHFDGQYSSLTGAPTNVSAFTNDAGYLTSFTETDPVFTASPAGTITNANIINWNTAWGWGNHADAGYLTSYTETDPVFSASPSAGILAGDITNWNTAYSWGDHSLAGYLTSYNEYTDADVDTHLNTGTATTDQVLSWNGVDYAWVDQSAGSSFTGDLAGNNLTNSLGDVTIDDRVVITGGLDTTTGGSTVLNARFGGAPADYLEFKNPAGPFAGSARLGVAQNVGAGFAAYLGWATNNGNRLQDIKATNDGADSGNHKLEYWMYAGTGQPVEIIASNPTVGKGVTSFDFYANQYNFNNGNAVFNNQVIANNNLEVSNSGNTLLQVTPNDVVTPSTFGGRVKFESNGSNVSAGDPMFVVNNSTGNNNGANFAIDGEMYITAHNHKPTDVFDVEHGMTVWTHNYLNQTHARDRSYMGKPLRLAAIPVGTTAPNPGVEVEGEFWLDTTAGEGNYQMRTWRDFGSGYAWQPVLTQDAGDILWDATSGAILYCSGGGVYTAVGAGGGGGASALNDLTDVTVTAPSDGDILRYNGVAGEFQNTNLGLSLTPIISGVQAEYPPDAFATVTIDNYGSYDDPNIWAQVVDSLDNVVVTNAQITDNYDGTFSFQVPNNIGTNFELQVKVQDFGDLASDTATATFDIQAITFNVNFRYYRITDFTGQNDSFGRIMVGTMRLYSQPAGAGTAYPPNMTDNTTPAPYVASAKHLFSTSYDYFKAFDANQNNTFWWNLGQTNPFDTWIQIDMGAPTNVQSIGLSHGQSGYDWSGCKLYGSNTGAFAGEETLIADLTGLITPWASNDHFTIG